MHQSYRRAGSVFWIATVFACVWFATVPSAAQEGDISGQLSFQIPGVSGQVWPISFSGQEGVSRLFHYELDFACDDSAIEPDQALGQAATVFVGTPQGGRVFHGRIAGFSYRGPGHEPGVAIYRAEVVPWLWLLSRNRNSRTFQDKSTPDIVQRVLQESGAGGFENRLKGNYSKREYVVQYQESDWDFISRLMEEEGIFYYFGQHEGGHTMVLGDAPSAWQSSSPPAALRYLAPGAGPVPPGDFVRQWSDRGELKPGKATLRDYNYRSPLLDLTVSATERGLGILDLEWFEYPGGFQELAVGEQRVQIRLGELLTGRRSMLGEASAARLVAGGRFTLAEHPRGSENGDYIVIAVDYSIQARGADSQSEPGSPQAGAAVACRFSCIPDRHVYRPPRTTPKPVIHGPQTAVVTGPPGEEIYIDKYGRIKVQFHWDRQGRHDQDSSCWVRVSQPLAGANAGILTVPRIGQEVIVDFLEGDPDRPIIIGRLYNADTLPPSAGGKVPGKPK